MEIVGPSLRTTVLGPGRSWLGAGGEQPKPHGRERGHELGRKTSFVFGILEPISRKNLTDAFDV